jgi:hypothetical protein
MKNTLVELIAIVEQMVDDNGTGMILAALENALINKRDAAFRDWENELTAREMAKEWNRMAQAVNTAHQVIG